MLENQEYFTSYEGKDVDCQDILTKIIPNVLQGVKIYSPSVLKKKVIHKISLTKLFACVYGTKRDMRDINRGNASLKEADLGKRTIHHMCNNMVLGNTGGVNFVFTIIK